MTSSILALESLASELEDFVQQTVSGAVSVKKYGGTLFTVEPDVNESQFCGVFVYKKHVHLSFSKGALLKDTKGVLQGSGKYRRHINFTGEDNLDFKYLAKLLKQSVRV